MRLDLHVHTLCSFDCTLSLAELEAAVCRRRLDGLAVLDHNDISCAEELERRASFRVIVGEEISTSEGGVAGLFLKERVPPRLSARETIERIHAQAGLVMIPHPLAHGTPGKIRSSTLRDVLPLVDVIEGYNARIPWAQDDVDARRLADAQGLPVTAGSDAHFAFEVGRAYTVMDDFDGPVEFLRSLTRARLVWTSKTPYLVSALTVFCVPVLGLWRRGNRREMRH